ncbi:Mur ligase family protein [Helicobacter sp. 23-1045]
MAKNRVDSANFALDSQNLNEVEIYMTKKGQEYRTINKSRSARIYVELKTHIAPPKRVIQVLGTNGKGSTGRFIAQILAQSGYKILHFTSPHIFSFNERFYDNNGVVSDENLTKAHRFLQKFAFASECSYFEYATFLALFLSQGVDFAILEAGVGGELDSTSVVRRDLCVFSVIDCDHTDILGDSIEAIATTKLNAVFYPNKVPKMLLGAQKYEIVQKIAESIAKKHEVEIFALDSREYNNPPSLAEGNSNSLSLPNARGGLRGWVDSQNNSSAKFVNSDFTHPLTPSAREGEQKVESAPTPSLRGAQSEASATKQSKLNCHTERSEVSLLDSANPSPNPTLKSLSFSQKGLHPPPRSPYAPKSSRFFAFRGSASLSPLLAKNRHSHYCSFESDFLHHEVGEIKGASHEFLLDSAKNASFCHTERSEVSQKNRDFSPTAQNDNFNLDCHDSQSESRNDESFVDCFGDKSSRNDELSVDSRHLDCHDLPLANLAMTKKMQNLNRDSSLVSLAQNDEIHIESYIQKHNLAPFLAQNLALALKATQIFGINANLKTLPKLDLHGRFECISPNITIDVGHNENAAFAIKQLLGDKKVILVYNSYFQKNIGEILGILKDNILRVEILPVRGNPRIIKRDILEGILTNLKIKFCEFGGAESIKDSAQNYLIFGSFSVVEAFMRDFAKAKRI